MVKNFPRLSSFVERFTNQCSGKKEWDRRIKVVFKPRGWCDKNIMKLWVSEDWGNHFLNPATPGSTGKILFIDMHGDQQTSSVKELLYKNKTVLINIHGGATSKVKSLDAVINKQFKNCI